MSPNDAQRRGAYAHPDIKELIGLVAKRHSISLAPGDPAFVLVTLFEEISTRHMTILGIELKRTLDQMTAASEAQKQDSMLIANQIVNAGGNYITQQVETAGEQMVPAIAKGVLAELQPTLLAMVAHTTAARRDRRLATWGAAASLLAAVIAVAFVMTGGSI